MADYEKELYTLGNETKQQTMAGWGYKWQWSDKANNIGGWTPSSEAAKSKYKTLYGEDYTGKTATLANEAGKKVISFTGSAFSAGLENLGYSLWNPNAIINQNQETDFGSQETSQAPPTHSMPSVGSAEDYLSPYKDLFEDYFGGVERPDLPNMEQAFRDEMSKYGIPDLEKSIADLTKDKQDEEALARQRKQAEEGKPVALGVIGGRTSEIDRQSYEKLDFIGRQLDYATNQLNTKYAMVNTIMNLKQTDYTNASNLYNSQFDQAMRMIEFTRGVNKDYSDEKWREYTEEQRITERNEDTARANLTVIYNSITEGTTDYVNLDDATKANITKMEMESGFPVGFVKTLLNNNPQQDIVSTTSRQEPNGDTYADIIMRDKRTGEITVQHVFLGNEKITGGGGGGDDTSINSAVIDNPQSFEDFIQQKQEQLNMSIADPESYRQEYNDIINSIGDQMGEYIVEGKQEGFDFLSGVIKDSPDVSYEELFILARTRTPDLSIDDIKIFLKSKGFYPTSSTTTGANQSTMSDEEFLSLLRGEGG